MFFAVLLSSAAAVVALPQATLLKEAQKRTLFVFMDYVNQNYIEDVHANRSIIILMSSNQHFFNISEILDKADEITKIKNLQLLINR